MTPSPKVSTLVAARECIYCGTAEGRLTDEHVIPFGIGGTIVVPKASCDACAKITSNFEMFCLRYMLGALRIRLDMPTRRKKRRPTELEVDYIRINGQRELVSIPVERCPAAYLALRFAPPGILRGAALTESFEGTAVALQIDDSIRRHMVPEGQKVKLGTIHLLYFAQMLAKMAHSFVVNQIGLNSFSPLLPDVILGRSPYASHFVGGDAINLDLPRSSDLHWIDLKRRSVNGVPHVLVSIRLFALITGSPMFCVVAGTERLGGHDQEPVVDLVNTLS